MSKVYDLITQRIIEQLEKGVVPWKKPWNGPDDFPKNLVSGKEYRGINVFLLSIAGYGSPYWLTFKQAQDRGGTIANGERGSPCVYFNWITPKDRPSSSNGAGDEKAERIPILRYYTVFNVEQTKGVDYPKPEVKPFAPLEECVKVVQSMPNPPQIRHGLDKAFYRPRDDLVGMPDEGRFEPPHEYYSTLFHELVHSTGHAIRLDRPAISKGPGNMSYGKADYSREELVAETGAAFLCGHCGIENQVLKNNAAYINSWLKVLKGDSKMVIIAASQGQKAADYILNKRQPEYMNDPESDEVAHQ